VTPTMAPAMMRTAPPRRRPMNLHLLLRFIPMHQRHDRRKEEEYAVHDAKRKARLEHPARLVDVEVERVERRAAKDP